MTLVVPSEVLPHGPGMQLLVGGGEVVDGWLTFRVNLTPTLSVVEVDGLAPSELGLEMMAQACGMLVAGEEHTEHKAPRVGVVGAVRGYSYDAEPFRVGEGIRVRVKADVCEDDLVVCEGELYRGDVTTPSQRARITLIVSGEVVG